MSRCNLYCGQWPEAPQLCFLLCTMGSHRTVFLLQTHQLPPKSLVSIKEVAWSQIEPLVWPLPMPLFLNSTLHLEGEIHESEWLPLSMHCSPRLPACYKLDIISDRFMLHYIAFLTDLISSTETSASLALFCIKEANKLWGKKNAESQNFSGDFSNFIQSSKNCSLCLIVKLNIFF